MTDQPALPTSPDELLARLDALGIVHRTISHPPLFTVEDSKALRGDLPGTHIKNLFLRDRRENMFLVVLQEDRRVDLKALAGVLGAGKLSFGSAERLRRHLGVLPGAVTPFAAINDSDGRVAVWLDRAVLQGGTVHCHPLVNTMTTAIATEDLQRFFAATGHVPLWLDFPL